MTLRNLNSLPTSSKSWRNRFAIWTFDGTNVLKLHWNLKAPSGHTTLSIPYLHNLLTVTGLRAIGQMLVYLETLGEGLRISPSIESRSYIRTYQLHTLL